MKRTTLAASSVRFALLPLALCVLAAAPSRASDYDLLSIAVRARVGEKRVLGTVQPESFREYDVMATLRLPWEERLPSTWGIGTRLLVSAGVLYGAGKSALVASVIPVVAIGTPDGRFTLDLGAGLALLSRHRYAQQDFGGPVQFALTVGVGVPLHERIGVGYRFVHYSDARVYGRGTTGADFHMVELIWRF